MKKLDRPPAPRCLATDSEEARSAQRARYADLRYPSGGFRAHWNELDKDESGVSAPRRALLAMSQGECAYCGVSLGNEQMEVDHHLPKECFPWIAHAWDNLLPICGPCNKRKARYAPPSLRDKVIVEECLRETHPHDLVFDKTHLLGEVASDERLIDPSFDDPSEHIELLLDGPSFRAKTNVGKVTLEKLFHRRELIVELRKIRDLTHTLIREDIWEEMIELTAERSRYPSYFRRFIDYWRTEQREGRFERWDD